MARITRAAAHLSIEEVKQRLKHDPRPWCRQCWLVIYKALIEPREASDTRPIRTDRSRFGEMIARQCDSLLLLTATPHNGYRQGFYSLLHLLDDARFASAQDMHRETIQQVVIRRSKKQIFTSEGEHKFHDRTVDHIELSINDPAMKAQRRLYDELNKYVARYWRKVKDKPNERATVGFAMTLLKKTLYQFSARHTRVIAGATQWTDRRGRGTGCQSWPARFLSGRRGTDGGTA